MRLNLFMLLCSMSFLSFSAFAEQAGQATVGDLSHVRSIVIDRGITEAGKECINCHQKHNPGILNDWKNSRHAHVGVSCIDCHSVNRESPMATQHETLEGTDQYVSALVPPSTCARCHANESDQFKASGHFRAYRQIIPKDSLHALVQRHEGRNHPELSNAPDETGCMQCHGTRIQLDNEGRPLATTWPNAGMGNIYPDGSTGNCSACHTRHRFSIVEPVNRRHVLPVTLVLITPTLRFSITANTAISTILKATVGSGMPPRMPGSLGITVDRRAPHVI